MKIFVAIGSYIVHAENGCNQAMRDTWLADLTPPFDYKFFLGNNVSTQADEIPLNIEEGYYSAANKVLAICEYFVKNDYDYLFQCWTDLYARPERLLLCGFENYDYVGDFAGDPYRDDERNYASGGAGYWLSRKAASFVLAGGIPQHWADDVWVGRVTAGAGLRRMHDCRYLRRRQYITRSNEFITAHLSWGTGNYDKQLMYEYHNVWRKS